MNEITLDKNYYSDKVMYAAALVKEAHAGQFRKDGKTPYYTHPYAVTDLVRKYVGDNEVILVSALAHDCVEDIKDFDFPAFLDTIYPDDTHMSEKHRIKENVMALTKNDTIPNRHDKDVDSYDRIYEAGGDALIIKLCDRIHNISDMEGMTLEFKRRYIAETYFMLGIFENQSNKDAYKDLLNLTIKLGNKLFK